MLEALGLLAQVPNIKRLTIKSVPEESTRLAMLKKGEADFAAAMQGEIAEDVKRDPTWPWCSPRMRLLDRFPQWGRIPVGR